jgi:aminomethyltransferase
VGNVIISATGYTGSGGVEIYFEDNGNDANIIWDKLMELNIKPIGLGARDTLRLEMGYCLYGNDIDDTTSPLEGGLGWITKFTKDFTAKAILEQQKAAGITRKLIGFEMIDRGIPRHDYLLKDADGNTIGKVTSGTQAPSLNKAVGLGYVSMPFAATDTEIFVDIRNNLVKAKVVKLPFM